MQFRGPAENGKKAKGLIFDMLSNSKRSGMNDRGSFQIKEFDPITSGAITIFAPLGSVLPSEMGWKVSFN